MKKRLALLICIVLSAVFVPYYSGLLSIYLEINSWELTVDYLKLGYYPNGHVWLEGLFWLACLFLTLVVCFGIIYFIIYGKEENKPATSNKNQITYMNPRRKSVSTKHRRY